MPIKISIQAAREKLKQISLEIGNERLVEAAKKGCVDSIASRIIESGNSDLIVKKFFEEFLGGSVLSDRILRYEGNQLKDIVRFIGIAIEYNQDIFTDTERFIEAFEQEPIQKIVNRYEGLARESVASKIMERAYYTKDIEEFRRFAEVFDDDLIHESITSSDENIQRNFIRIINMGRGTDDADKIRRIVYLIKKYEKTRKS
ncbi:MAG: hypothetical protein QMD85_02905 [Candidatus Aenigmarchaeota archaeon]|nr:hypothetical protein [Candidatus Aenigmarchaeota archaeon]MDI6722497.1 hypothetical protein [Candidatus Aenigmarchaeota archaeon]